jgi:hypothetical protein
VWQCGSVAAQECGSVAVWQCGSVAVWQCGSVAVWQCGRKHGWSCRALHCAREAANVSLLSSSVGWSYRQRSKWGLSVPRRTRKPKYT